MPKNTISRRALVYPLLMLLLMWCGFMLQSLGFFQGCQGALIPLEPQGLKGIFFSPLLHGSLDHIIGNSVPVAVLIFLLYQFYPAISDKVFALGWLMSGFLVWLLPPIDIFTGDYSYTCIIGASGIVYVLAFFLFFSGVFRWNMRLLTVSLLVALYYGGLVWGMLPEELFYRLDEPSKIAWQSHLSGAVVGVILAYMFRKIGEKPKRFIWQFPNYYSEKDDELWQRYKETHPDDFMQLPQKKPEKIWDHLDEILKQK